MIAFAKRSILYLCASTIRLSLAAYSVAWILTYSLAHLFWGRVLPGGSKFGLALAFLLPLTLVAGTILCSRRTGIGFKFYQYFFLFLTIFVFLNLIIFHFPLHNYGDNGFLSERIDANMLFERWMLGSKFLNSIYYSIWYPLVNHNLLPFPAGADIFLRLSGGIWMGLFSFFLIKRYPNKLSIVLPLILPLWILLLSGYNEYYPFIAPILLGIMVFLSQSDMKTISPIWMGLLMSAFGLAYAGFLPISMIILFIYALRVGFRKSLIAGLFSIVFTILFIAILWPTSLPEFLKLYIHHLNLGERNTIYTAYRGNALAYTPFFTLKYSLSWSNLKDKFFMFFWGGGLALIAGIIAATWIWLKRYIEPVKHARVDSSSTNIEKPDKINFLTIGLVALWQCIYIIIKIPRLGPFVDIDLFFSVYIILAYVTGLLFDKILQDLSPEKLNHWRTVIFSFFIGNTALIILFLIFRGLPVPI
jgi:hypothetical protein